MKHALLKFAVKFGMLSSMYFQLPVQVSSYQEVVVVRSPFSGNPRQQNEFYTSYDYVEN